MVQKRPSTHELRTFRSNIYPITPSFKNLDDRTQEVPEMGYTNSRDTMKWWYTHTKKLKYCSSENFDEHDNKFGKG